MNSVILIGRLTRNPETRYTANSQMAVTTFTVAINRPRRDGQEQQADFPRVTVFGKQAENCEKYLTKGRLVGIQGRLQTGSYQNKDGITVYTTDVVADRVEFLEWGDRQIDTSTTAPKPKQSEIQQEINMYMPEEMPDSFQAINEDVPF